MLPSTHASSRLINFVHILCFSLLVFNKTVHSYAGTRVQIQRAQRCVRNTCDFRLLMREKECEHDLDCDHVSTQSSRRTFLSTVATASLVTMAVPAVSNAAVRDSNEADVPTPVKKFDLPSTAVAAADSAAIDWNGILSKASKKALGGGKAGASAAVVQVLSLMWLRTRYAKKPLDPRFDCYQ